MPTDFEPLKRLPPETKVVELRRLIDNLKKRVEEHQRDIRTAESLLTLAEDEQKVIEQETERTETKSKVKEEKKPETKLQPQRGPELEKIVGGETRKQQIEELSRRPISELYQEIRSIYQSQQKTGIETREQRERVYELRGGVYEKRKDMEEGSYKPAAQQKHLLTSTEQLVNSMYQDNKDQQQRVYRRTE